MHYQIRKTVVSVETTHHDGGPPPEKPLRIVVAAAVVANPFAGRYEADLMPFMNGLKPLSMELTRQALEALGASPAEIQVFGKGGIVGTDGELEHAAMWHAPGGGGMKDVLGAKGWVAGGKMVGAVGARLQIPLVYVESQWVRSHYNTIEIGIHDAPRPRELVFALAMGTGGRIHARLGGLTPTEAAAGNIPKL
jgi:hypothetical protein